MRLKPRLYKLLQSPGIWGSRRDYFHFKEIHTRNFRSLQKKGSISGKEPTCQCRRLKKHIQSQGWEDALERKWQPTPEFLPGESHGQRSLAGYSPLGFKEMDTTEVTSYTLKKKKIVNWLNFDTSEFLFLLHLPLSPVSFSLPVGLSCILTFLYF